MKRYIASHMMRHGVPIHIFYQEEKGAAALHTHDFIEIVYIASGSALETVNGETFRVGRGDLLFLNYGSSHAFEAVGQFSYYNICFAPDLPAERLIAPENAFGILALTAFDEMRREAESGRVCFSGDDRRRIEEILSAMLREYERMEPSARLVLESYMNILIAQILRKTLPAPEETARDTWQTLREYIEQNISEPLSLSTLARQCFYNPSYFSRVFKEKFGVPLTTYVGQRRMELAKERLRTTEEPVAQIALECGFSTAGAFYRVFERECGVTPSSYRLAEKSKKSE